MISTLVSPPYSSETEARAEVANQLARVAAIRPDLVGGLAERWAAGAETVGFGPFAYTVIAAPDGDWSAAASRWQEECAALLRERTGRDVQVARPRASPAPEG